MEGTAEKIYEEEKEEGVVTVAERDITAALETAFNNLFKSIGDKRTDRNHFASGLRIFKHETAAELGFPPA